MKFKKIIFLTLLLVIILTMGSVSASDSNATSETLAVDDLEINQDEIISASDEDNIADNGTVPPPKTTPTMSADADDVLYGDDATVEVTINDDATGSIQLDCSGNIYNTAIVAGKASFILSGLDIGSYVITATYAGDENYNQNTAVTSFSVLMPTFENLQDEIDAASSGATITLTRDYESTGTPIIVSKPLTIDGDGHTLDAKGLSSIFSIMADDCMLLNLRLCNAVGNGSGAIYWQGNGGAIISINCTNNTGEYARGGAICIAGSNINITNSIFTFNETGFDIEYGGALYIAGDDVSVIQSIFTGFNATKGGAIYVEGSNVNIVMSTFSNSSAEYGGSIYWAGNNGNVMMSTFCNSTATSDGGAIYWQGSAGSIQGCVFENCSAINGGAIYGTNTTVLDSHFTNNVASGDGGAIYNCSYNDECEFESNTDPAVYPFKRNVTMTINANSVLVGDVLNVSVILSENITASITIIFDNAHYDVTAIDGKSQLNIPATKSGSFEIKAIFEGNDNYLPVNETVSVTVSKHDLAVVFVYDEVSRSISIILPHDIADEVNFTIGSINKSLTESEVINISSLNPGNYTYTIRYAGDDKYKAYDASDSLTVPKFNPNIELAPFNIQYGEGKNITVGIESDVEGNVTFILINGKTDETIETVTLAPDNMYQLPGLDTGIYKLQVNYIGDAKYSHESREVSFKVSPILNISPEVMVGENGLITMELGNVTGTIRVSVDGEEYGSSRISAGKFTYYLPTDELTAGNHSVTFQYSGTSFDENVFNYWDNETGSYKPIKYILKVTHKQTTTVSNSDNDNILEVKIEDNEGKVLTNATGEVEFTILNQLTQQYSKVVVSVVNGIAKLDISKFKDGNYLISWDYLGDAQHAPISKQLTLKVTHKASRIAAGDLSLLYTTSKTYSVTVYSAGGQALSGMSVSFLINNKVVKTTTTNANGVASIVISQVPGSYKITAKSGSATITKKLTVTHLVSLKSVKVKKSAKKVVLQATLKKVNGKYLKNKKVTFKFNGKKLTAKTNKKGVAKVTVKSNVLKKLKAGKKVTYQATYLKDTVKKSVKVKK